MAAILVAVVASLLCFSLSQGAVIDKSSQNQISWKDSVRDSSSLAQVLKEYLSDIETVEATGSPCVQDHRTRLSSAQGVLRAQLDKCGESSGQKEAVKKCLEDNTKTTVSDVRQHIVELKTCVDKC